MSWGAMGLDVLQFLLPIFGTILTIVLAALARKALQKAGIERSNQIDAMIDKYVGIGVNFADRAATKKLGGRAYKGEDKMRLAITTVMGELEQSGLKKVGEDLIRARIEDYLHVGEAKVPTLTT